MAVFQASRSGILKVSTSYVLVFQMVDTVDVPKTGITPVVNISKNGGVFAAAAGVVAEIANGYYKVTLTTVDTNTVGDLAFYITGTGADDTSFVCQVFSVGFGELTSAAIQAIWDALTAAFVTAGSIGKKLADLSLGTDNRVKVSADAHTAGAAVASVTAAVTVGTNNDKINYTLSASGLTAVENQVLNAAVSGHATAGSIGAHIQKDPWDVVVPGAYASGKSGNKLGNAVTSDPWATALPGSYGAGTGGKIVGDNLNATISSRSTLSSADVQTAVDNRLDAVGTELLSIPSTIGSLRQKINFIFQYFRNRRTVTATTETSFKEDAITSLGTSTISDDGTTFIKGEMN